MKLYPCSKYIPLTLCKENSIDKNMWDRNCYYSKGQMFQEYYFVSFDKIENIVVRIETPQSGRYLYDKYGLYNGSDEIFLVLVCKPTVSGININPSIPEKSEWIIIKNISFNDEKSVINRYIKNFLQITNKKQIISMQHEDIENLFGGNIEISMRMYNEEYQKHISSQWLTEYKQLLAI